LKKKTLKNVSVRNNNYDDIEGGKGHWRGRGWIEGFQKKERK